MTKRDDLKKYLEKNIPLSTATGLEVYSDDQGLPVLLAPFAPNRNHKNTVFGGSLNVLAILAGWTYFHELFSGLNFAKELVIRDCQMKYLKPVESSFVARVVTPSKEKEKNWTEKMSRKKTLPVSVDIQVFDFYEGEGGNLNAFDFEESEASVRMQAKFVCLRV